MAAAFHGARDDAELDRAVAVKNGKRVDGEADLSAGDEVVVGDIAFSVTEHAAKRA